jgi:hypothetical protein
VLELGITNKRGKTMNFDEIAYSLRMVDHFNKMEKLFLMMNKKQKSSDFSLRLQAFQDEQKIWYKRYHNLLTQQSK